LIAVGQPVRSDLESAAIHLLGQSRAYLLQVEAAYHEIGSMHDERAARLVESLGLAFRERPAPGTPRHVELAAADLLRRFREEAG
jgi:hypothetical protein